jgi:hypothetical protein
MFFRSISSDWGFRSAHTSYDHVTIITVKTTWLVVSWLFHRSSVAAWMMFFACFYPLTGHKVCSDWWFLNYILVGGWNMNFMTFHSVGNVIIPTDELIFLRGVGQPPTRRLSQSDGNRPTSGWFTYYYNDGMMFFINLYIDDYDDSPNITVFIVMFYISWFRNTLN